MIRGNFDRGRPQVECRLVIPRLSVNHRLMLLVDTGASATCLHPADAIRAGIPFERLGNRIDYRLSVWVTGLTILVLAERLHTSERQRTFCLRMSLI